MVSRLLSMQLPNYWIHQTFMYVETVMDFLGWARSLFHPMDSRLLKLTDTELFKEIA